MRYLILTIFVLFSFQAKGEVDGWKDFKFGMSKGEVKDLLIRYQKNNKLRTEEGKYGIIPCGIKEIFEQGLYEYFICLLYTSPSPRDLSTSRMPSSA